VAAGVKIARIKLFDKRQIKKNHKEA